MSRGARTARKAVARSAAADRTLTGLIGALALAAGALALVVGFGVLGADRSTRALLDPLALEALRSHLGLARGLAIGLGVLLLVLGLVWAAGSLRPERRPDLVLDSSAEAGLRVSSAALRNALTADAQGLPGVGRALVRMVGDTAHPAVRLTLWLEDGADLREVWDELDTRVLAPARESLGVASLPTAVRLELETAPTARVS